MPYIEFSGDLIDKSSIIALHKDYTCFPVSRWDKVETYFIKIALSSGQTLSYRYGDKERRDDKFEKLVKLVGVKEKD